MQNINSNLWGGDVVINSANKIFPSDKAFGLQQTYKDALQVYFNTSETTLNYSNPKLSADTINEWIASKTNNKIKNLIDANSLREDTRLVLVNTLYFKGSWQIRFDNSTREDFNLSNGETKKVDMMYFTLKKRFKVLERPNGLRARTCELLYNGTNLAMTIILPDDNLADVEKNLTAETLNIILQDNNQGMEQIIFRVKNILYIF
jgi:serpin B